VFDNEKRENPFSEFHTFEIGYGDAKPPICAVYMAAWLSAPNNAKVVFKRDSEVPGIHSILMRSASETIEFFRDGKNCAVLRSTNGRARKYNFREATLTSLLTEELSIAGTDAAFNMALARVGALIEHAS
jgi:hypothetical protein